MEEEAPELLDWEVLQGSESPIDTTRDLEVVDDDSGGFVRSNYFTLESIKTSIDACEERSVVSDNPSWIEPNEIVYQTQDGRNLLFESGSHLSESSKLSEAGGYTYLESERGVMNVQFSDRTGREEELDQFRFLCRNLEQGFVENNEQPAGFKDEDAHQSWSKAEELCVEYNCSDDYEELESESNGSSRKNDGEESVERVNETSIEYENDHQISEDEKKKVVWWKLPLEFVKFCVFRVGPIWSFSVAAALIGFIILGKRLYKMKKKTQGFEIKVSIDDKKISQFKSRAARLNEAFSMVRRSPVIRPSLPTPGVGVWPAFSLR